MVCESIKKDCGMCTPKPVLDKNGSVVYPMIPVPAFVIRVPVKGPPADETIGGEVAGKVLGEGREVPSSKEQQRGNEARKSGAGQ
jgi:hypothetical protein